MIQMVMTSTKGLQPKHLCRFIKNEYHLIGDRKIENSGCCYLINETYYRISSDKIAWDLAKKEYNIKNNLINVITTINGVTEQAYSSEAQTIKGKGYLTVIDKSGASFYCYNVDVNLLNYDLLSGYYYLCDEALNYIVKNFRIRNSSMSYNSFNTRNFYGYDDYLYNEKTFIQKLSSIFDTHNEHTYYEYLFEVAQDLSNGIEIETSFSTLPEEVLLKYGFFTARDGSITGNEYISLPMSNINHYNNLFLFLKECNKYCAVNFNNSLHINIGNIKVDDELKFSVALYTLYQRLQKELHKIIPPYKFDKIFNANNRSRDYCKRLPAISVTHSTKSLKERVDRLFTFLNDNQAACSSYNFETRKHRHYDRAKWNIPTRYYELNLMKYHFSKNKTVEFRLHSGTIDLDKVFYWTIFCNNIVNYTIKNTDDILNGNLPTLKDLIISENNLEVANDMLDYFKQRIDFFKTCQFDSYVKEFENEGIQQLITKRINGQQ